MRVGVRSWVLGLIGLAGTGVFAQDAPQTFKHQAIGIQFDYPADWQTAKERDGVRILIPLGESARASLEVHPVAFRSEPERWQESQRAVNEQMRREIVRQWQEEILGVPMLLTKVQYLDAGEPKALLIGLIYSSTPQKLLFRLTVPSGQYDNAEYRLRQALESIRTLDGTLPKEEDPTRPAKPPVEKDPPKEQKVTKLLTRPGKRYVGPVQTECVIAETAYALCLPEEWALEKTETGYRLSHPLLKGTAHVRVFSTAEAPARRTLSQTASLRLSEYRQVSRREERLPEANRAGAAMAFVWREGDRVGGSPFSSFDAVGQSAEVYWLLEYRLEGAALTDAERALIRALADRMSLEALAP